MHTNLVCMIEMIVGVKENDSDIEIGNVHNAHISTDDAVTMIINGEIMKREGEASEEEESLA